MGTSTESALLEDVCVAAAKLGAAAVLLVDAGAGDALPNSAISHRKVNGLIYVISVCVHR